MRHQFIAVVVICLSCCSLASAQNLLINGDFEADTFTAWPGYTGGDNPEEITGWMRNLDAVGGNIGINPVFEPQNPSSVVGWTRNEDSAGGIGINPVSDGRQPFGDNGDSDGGFLFMQGDVSVFQEVSGLTVGEDYVLTVDYNARNCCGDLPLASLALNGEFSDDFPDPEDFIDELVEPVEVGAWWFAEIPIKADSTDLRIEFFASPEALGDATFLLDNIGLEPAGGGDNLLVNGDFEAELDQFEAWPGYLGNEDAGPRAPFRDNGSNDTRVALLQNTAGIDQLVEGLTVGDTYTLSLEYNARNCCGAIPAPELLLDGEPIVEFPNEEGLVDPVGDENDWYAFETEFVAEFESVVLTIQNESDIEGGDSTLVIDNVFLGIPISEVVGDINGDGSFGRSDIDAFVKLVAANEVREDTDLNSDGKLDVADIDAFLDPQAYGNGDMDWSGEVGFSDFLTLSNNFGLSGDEVAWTKGDLNGDDMIGFPDFLILSANFGNTGAVPVPEPHSQAMLFGGLLVLAALRRNYSAS